MKIGDIGWISELVVVVDKDGKIWVLKHVDIDQEESYNSYGSIVKIEKDESGYHIDMRRAANKEWEITNCGEYSYIPIKTIMRNK